jgi:cytochrome c-type biogenesis protein CcmH
VNTSFPRPSADPGAFRRTAAGILLAMALVVPPATQLAAREAPEVGSDPAVERHMMELASELRCLQCQNQTLADSNAPLAVDLRGQIRDMVASGQSDEQIKQYLVARYGDFVLFRPPVKAVTWPLWFGPGVLLLGGLAALYLVLLRRRRLAAAEPLSADQEKRAIELLSENEGQLS